MSASTRLLLVDRQVLFTDALAYLLSANDDFIVTAARTGGEALTIAATRPPSVAIVELAVPDIGGLATMRGLRALCPGTTVIALAGSAESCSAFEVLDAGASGLVSKESSASDLVRAIRSAAFGGPTERRRTPPTSPEPRFAAERRAVDRRLTEREVSVLRLAAAGLSNRRIAETLFLSEHTVLGYLKSVSAKLGVHSKLQAVVRGISEGLISLPAIENEAAPVSSEQSNRTAAEEPH